MQAKSSQQVINVPSHDLDQIGLDYDVTSCHLETDGNYEIILADGTNSVLELVKGQFPLSSINVDAEPSAGTQEHDSWVEKFDGWRQVLPVNTKIRLRIRISAETWIQK